MLTKVAAKRTGMMGVNWCDCHPALTLHRPWARLARLAGRKMEQIVAVIDDDESVRESLPDLLREFGFAVQAFSSAEEFLASDSVARTGCLILDIAMPGMSGPDLQQELMRQRHAIPIVFITAHGDDTVRPPL